MAAKTENSERQHLPADLRHAVVEQCAAPHSRPRQSGPSQGRRSLRHDRRAGVDAPRSLLKSAMRSRLPSNRAGWSPAPPPSPVIRFLSAGNVVTAGTSSSPSATSSPPAASTGIGSLNSSPSIVIRSPNSRSAAERHPRIPPSRWDGSGAGVPAFDESRVPVLARVEISQRQGAGISIGCRQVGIRRKNILQRKVDGIPFRRIQALGTLKSVMTSSPSSGLLGSRLTVSLPPPVMMMSLPPSGVIVSSPPARVDDLGYLCSGQFLAAVGALHQARNREQAGGFELGEGRRILPLLSERHAIQRNRPARMLDDEITGFRVFHELNASLSSSAAPENSVKPASAARPPADSAITSPSSGVKSTIDIRTFCSRRIEHKGVGSGVAPQDSSPVPPSMVRRPLRQDGVIAVAGVDLCRCRPAPARSRRRRARRSHRRRRCQ